MVSLGEICKTLEMTACETDEIKSLVKKQKRMVVNTKFIKPRKSRKAATAKQAKKEWQVENDPWQEDGAQDDTMGSKNEPPLDATPPAPRLVNVWGETICVRLLQESSLVVCKLKRHDLEGEVEVLVKCEPKDNFEHQWNLFFLAAPRKLLMLRGETSVAFCVRHGSSLQEASAENSHELFQITQCLHPAGHIASLMWNRIVQDAWSGVCREAVEAVLCRTNLTEWQFPLMHKSLSVLQDSFRVDPEQMGLFARPDRSHRSGTQQQTHEQRQLDGNLPYEVTRGHKQNKVRRRNLMQDGTDEPRVWKILQDSMITSEFVAVPKVAAIAEELSWQCCQISGAAIIGDRLALTLPGTPLNFAQEVQREFQNLKTEMQPFPGLMCEWLRSLGTVQAGSVERLLESIVTYGEKSTQIVPRPEIEHITEVLAEAKIDWIQSQIQRHAPRNRRTDFLQFRMRSTS
eukprot:s2744_g9.t1